MKLFRIYGSGFHGCYLDVLVWANDKAEAFRTLCERYPKYKGYDQLDICPIVPPSKSKILDVIQEGVDRD